MSLLVVGTQTCRYPDEGEPGAPRGKARPAGPLHAVPAGGLLTLCGITPRYVWDDIPWRRRRSPGDDKLCPSCELIDESMPGGRSRH